MNGIGGRVVTKNSNYDVIASGQGAPVKMWTRGVPVDEPSKQQLLNTASLPFIYKWLAVALDERLWQVTVNWA
jgi:tRNA-splicing ligase RtcB (3'-phosphate/5'-hydroxy nucleic acid ligase)